MNESMNEGKKEEVRLANRSGLILCLPSFSKGIPFQFQFQESPQDTRVV